MKEIIKGDSAILVIHGIGNQNPLETLDQFSRGLIKTLVDEFNIDDIKLTHKIEPKPRSKDGFWHDNYIRISSEKKSFNIDIYEYYWANLTQDKVQSTDIKKWVVGVRKGARKFHKDIADMIEITKKNQNDTNVQSEVSQNEDAGFSRWKHYLILGLATSVFPMYQLFLKGVYYLMGWWIPIPFVRSYFQKKWTDKTGDIQTDLNNVIGDVVVYNTLDAKSHFYTIKKQIRDGAVKSLRWLIEPEKINESNYKLKYNSVLVAGHSLGSQISFDLFNRLNHHISDNLRGLITFGSPLDKIKYFIRENVPHEQYIRLQMLDNFHSFRKKIPVPEAAKDFIQYDISAPYESKFEEIKWLNFYDHKDYVSGRLDYYKDVENIDCKFKGNNPFRFTHSWYWRYNPMYKKIVDTYFFEEN